MEGKRILMTGLTGQVGKPVALALARDNDVIGVARFGDATTRDQLEAAGVTCIAVDFDAADFDAAGVPDDVDHVLNFAVAKTTDFDADIRSNVEALGLLLAHCRSATSVLHCSSTAVYQPNGRHAFAETDELGDNHRVMSFMPTYSICKIAAETMVRFCSRAYDLPATIARLNVPYGDNGGWPWLHLELVLAAAPIAVHPDAPSVYNPIHEDDIIATVPRLLEVASTPATIVNWGGDEAVSIEEWSAYLGELVGAEAVFEHTEQALESVTVDLTLMHELVGHTTVHWRDGMRRMVQTFHPEIELQA